MSKKPITLADVIRGEGGLRNATIMLGERNSDPKLRAAVARELAAAAARGQQFERHKGSKNDGTAAIEAHVLKLVQDNNAATHEQLYQLADRGIIAEMPRDTFKRFVTTARKQLGINSRPGRRRK